MWERCYNPKATSYPRYGAKGIKMWEPWHDARAFIQGIEALLGPRPIGHTVDRINPHDGYYEWNVRWVDASNQRTNSRRMVSDYAVQSGEH
jgi:hypothetical protein